MIDIIQNCLMLIIFYLLVMTHGMKLLKTMKVRESILKTMEER